MITSRKYPWLADLPACCVCDFLVDQPTNPSVELLAHESCVTEKARFTVKKAQRRTVPQEIREFTVQVPARVEDNPHWSTGIKRVRRLNMTVRSAIEQAERELGPTWETPLCLPVSATPRRMTFFVVATRPKDPALHVHHTPARLRTGRMSIVEKVA